MPDAVLDSRNILARFLALETYSLVGETDISERMTEITLTPDVHKPLRVCNRELISVGRSVKAQDEVRSAGKWASTGRGKVVQR